MTQGNEVTDPEAPVGPAPGPLGVGPVPASELDAARDDLFELAPLFRRLSRRWLLLLTTTVAVAALVFGLSFLLPKKFESTVLVMPVSSEGTGSALRSLASQFGAVAALAGVDVSNGSLSTSQAIALLQSRDLIQEFVTDRALMPILFARDWDEDAGQWKASVADDPPTLEDAYRLIRRKVLVVDEDRRTGLVTIKVTWTDPRTAAAWATELVQRANDRAREIALRDADQSMQHLRRELEQVSSVEVRSSIAMLIESQLNRKVVAQVRPDFALRILDPAFPSDIDNFVSPSRPVFLAAGLVAGFLCALLLVWILESRQR